MLSAGTTEIAADQINIQAVENRKAAISATQDINNIGGTLFAGNALILQAGNNINSQSTIASSQNTQGSSTHLDRIAGIYITGAEQGVLAAQAGNDINIIASQISNQSEQGQAQLQAGRNINLDTVQTSKHQATHFDADNQVIRGSTNEISSSIQTQGEVTLLAGNNLNAKAAQVSSANGTLAVSVKNDINISAGINTTHVDDASKHKGRSGGGNKLLITDKAQSHNETAQRSTFDGKQVVLQAGNNANIKSSNIISDNGTQIQAGNHVHIGTTQTHNQSETYHQTKKSGLMRSGIGFTIGSKTNTQENQSQSTEHTGSTIGSLKGDTTIMAGKHYQQIGSTVSSPEGNNTIQAQSIDIQAAHNQLNSNTTQTHEQKGLTVAFSSPVTDLAQQAINTVQSGKKTGQSKNGRVKAMSAANTGWQAYQTGKRAQNLANGTSNANQVSISITYGEQKNQQTTQIQANQAQASQIIAGKKATLIATGAGEQSNIAITGSDVAGKAGTTLMTDNDITLQSAEQTSSERSNNKSSGWNAGVAVSFGQGDWSLGITAGGNYGKGYGNGDDTIHRNSHIGSAEGQTTIQSGGDSTLKGAQVIGKGAQVNAKNLSIQSIQDSETYQSKQQNASAQITVGYGANASGDYSQSKINASHQSVSEQSGIYAGENGSQINIKNHTDLKGGTITSTQKAEEDGKNRFTTGTLTFEDLANKSEYSGSGFGIGVSGSVKGNAPANSHIMQVSNKTGVSHNGIGYASDSDSQSSATHSGINTANITIRDNEKQQQIAGKTAEETKAQIHTDTTTDTAQELSGSLKNNFDKDKVQSEIDLQVKVTKEFDSNRQALKQELYAQVDEKRARATKIREENGGYDTKKSERLDKEASELDEKVRWIDAGLGLIWGAGSSDMAWGMFATTQADRAKRSATAPKEMWFEKKIVDEKTGEVKYDTRQIWSINDLTDEERASIQDANGKVLTVSNPGIFNNREDALKNAAKQNLDKTDKTGVIVVMNPATGKYSSDNWTDKLWLISSFPSELIYVGYDQINNKIFQGYLPKTNSEKLNQNIYREAQQWDGWVVDTSNHSRGGITASVALKDWVNHQEQNGIAPIRKARFYGTATNVKNDYADVLQKNGYTYTGADGKTYNSGAYSIVHDKDFVGNKWISFLLGNNETSPYNNCKGVCYSHSSYFAEVPEQYEKDKNGQIVIKNGNPVVTKDWEDYTRIWGIPEKDENGKYINKYIPKLVEPNKPNGDRYEDSPF